MLKYLPKDSLKRLGKNIFLLYSKQAVYYKTVSLNRRVHNRAGTTNATLKANNTKDLNIDDRISQFQDQL